MIVCIRIGSEAPDLSGLSLRYLRESGQPAEITTYEPVR